MGSKNNYRLDLIKILFYLLGLPSGLDDSGRLCLSFISDYTFSLYPKTREIQFFFVLFLVDKSVLVPKEEGQITKIFIVIIF